MRKIRRFVALLALVPGVAAAGEIYGRITEGGKPVGEGVAVGMTCGGKAAPAAQTDKTGSYHVVADKEGKCALSVTYKGQTATLDVMSYEDPVQVDIVLEVKDGKLALRRK